MQQATEATESSFRGAPILLTHSPFDTPVLPRPVLLSDQRPRQTASPNSSEPVKPSQSVARMSVSIGGGGAAAAGLNAASFAPAGFQEATDTYRKLQQELGGHVQKQAQFQAQHNENTLVKEELDSLKDGESVYKLVGKVLVRQEASEAKATVNGRLEFIGKELARAELAIRATQEKLAAQRRKIMEMQQHYAAAQKAAAGAGAGGR